MFYKEAEAQKETEKKGQEETGFCKPRKKGILDSKSSQNVEICLKKYKMTAQTDFLQLAKQLQDPAQLAIDITLAENLVQYWPEAENVEAYKNKTQEEALQMPTADQLFYFLINDVPLCCDRLKFFIE